MSQTEVKLEEVPFFGLLPVEVQAQFTPYRESIRLSKVEVFPTEKRWVLHLSLFSPVEQETLQLLAKSLERRLNYAVQVEIRLRNNFPVNLTELCRDHWQDIVRYLIEKAPSLKGWLRPPVQYKTEEETLTIYVPNETALEYCHSKQDLLETCFQEQYGCKIRVNWEIDGSAGEESYFDPEKEEQMYLENMLAANKQREEPTLSNVLLGRNFKGDPCPLQDIADEERQVIVEGEVCVREIRHLKTGRQLLTFGLTDKTNSINCKLFFEEGQAPLPIAEGNWLKVRGPVQFDKVTTELTLMPKDILSVPRQRKMDGALEKRVELHLHTKMSEMDGISSVQSLINRAGEWGHQAIAITDHGVVQAFPEATEAAQKFGLKVIFGMEGYLVENPPKGAGQAKVRPYHIIILAKNKTGLKNLYKLVTISHLEHYYRRPLIPRSVLNEYREGLILGSACEAGELMRAFFRGAGQEEIKKTASFYDYLEIQPVSNNLFLLNKGEVESEERLREINRQIAALGRELDIPVVATCDVHFLDREDEIFRRILLTGKGFADADQPNPLYFRTTEEMLQEFSYLGEEEASRVVVGNPGKIAGQVEALKPFPDDFFEPKIEGASEKIAAMAWENAYKLYGNPLPEIVQKTMQKELDSIIGNGFSVLYLIAHLLVKKSNDEGYLVGSRGSVGSSLVATLTGITEVNPLPPHYRCSRPDCLYSEFIQDNLVGSGVDLPDKKCPRCGQLLTKDGHDIPFETFLGFQGDKVPDIDLNFSGEYQPRAHKYTEEIFGKENVFRAGTISTIAEKTAYGFVKNYLDEKNIKYNQTELNRLVQGCAGVKKTTGQHPGGLMVIPKECDILDFTPLQRPANDQDSDIITTHFDYHSISGRLVKLDILGHDDPTSIKMLEDLTGVDARKIPLDDQLTFSLFTSPQALGVTAEETGSKTGTFGIPEFGTKFVRQMLEDTKPTSFSHLVRISGLSHGTNVWVGNAQDLVLSGTADISQIIACRDDIMIYLIHKGLDSGQAFNIMEQVRKGKGLKPQDIEVMRQKDVPEWYILSCQKISYMFPKAHAVAYVTMAFRIAWFKLHYPEAFYATFFTVRADEFDSEMITAGVEECRKAVREITAKGNQATPREKNLLTILEIAVEMYCRKVKLRKVDLWESDATRFLVTPTGILPPFSSLQGLGKVAAANLVKIRKEKLIKSIEDLQNQGKLSKAVIEVLASHGCLHGLPEKNQLSLF